VNRSLNFGTGCCYANTWTLELSSCYLFPHGCRLAIGCHGWWEGWGRGLYTFSCSVLNPGFLTRDPDFGDFVWFWVASPGIAASPCLSPVAVQVPEYESKFKVFVLVLNCDLDGGFCSYWASAQRAVGACRISDARCGEQTRGASSLQVCSLVYLSHFLSGTSHIYVMIAPCLLYMLLYVEALEPVGMYSQFGLNTLE
jgi:hypothetical protein